MISANARCLRFALSVQNTCVIEEGSGQDKFDQRLGSEVMTMKTFFSDFFLMSCNAFRFFLKLPP